MAQNFPTRRSPDGTEYVPPYDEYETDSDDQGPSLPIILFSAASGVAGGVIGLYITYDVLAWEIQPSVFIAVLCLSLGIGLAGAGLSALTESRATLGNIALSCGLILVSMLFLGFCMLLGALAATFLLTTG